MIQTLMGDKTDGYSGAVGIGPKKAEAALGDCGNVAQMWKAVVALYDKKGQTEEEAILNCRMARILRVEDYDTENHRVKLWGPTGHEWLDLEGEPDGTPL
tara:strand:+ start:45 stop:344 length:300 start_codon:yes stop_codon:yes gene_type:complete